MLMADGVIASNTHLQKSLGVSFLLADPLILSAWSGVAHPEGDLVLLLKHDGGERKVKHVVLRIVRPSHTSR